MKALMLLAWCGVLPTIGAPVLPPAIQWQRSFGVTQEEFLYAVEEIRDGGYIIGGSSSSPAGGNKTAPNFGSQDYWIVRLDSQGNHLWDKSFGGGRFDILQALHLTVDGGFMLAGGSTSDPSGNKTSPHYGLAHDYWVLRLDANGNKIWEQTFGGVGDEISKGVEQTADSGFVIAGYSGSPISSNKTAMQFGSTDFWLVRLDASGTKLWDKSFGGSNSDDLWTFEKTRDGGFLLGGRSDSFPSGNKTSTNYGSSEYFRWTHDFWLVRVDADGNKLWDRSYGGTNDDVLYAVGELPDGGHILGGRSDSPPGGNKTSSWFGGHDYWVVRVDGEGNKLWEKPFGGDRNEELYSLDVTTDGGVILGGWSSSLISGNKTSTNFGGIDFWVIRLDADGNEVWQATYGGSRTDTLHSLKQTSDGGFILGGYSYSPADGNKTTPNWPLFPDFWVVKLAPEQPHFQILRAPSAKGCELALRGIKNLWYVLEWSTNLSGWLPFYTNRLNGAELRILDHSMTNSTQRFYRAKIVQ